MYVCAQLICLCCNAGRDLWNAELFWCGRLYLAVVMGATDGLRKPFRKGHDGVRRRSGVLSRVSPRLPALLSWGVLRGCGAHPSRRRATQALC